VRLASGGAIRRPPPSRDSALTFNGAAGHKRQVTGHDRATERTKHPADTNGTNRTPLRHLDVVPWRVGVLPGRSSSPDAPGPARRVLSMTFNGALAPKSPGHR